jgi:DNA-binding GntR family transcriptional regulator
MPIRDALRRLEGVGLVEQIPHRGARVTGLSIADLRSISQARLALEPIVITEAATSFSPQDLERAEEALTRLTRALKQGDRALIARTHSAFHFALYGAARSPWLLRLIRLVWETSERYVNVLLDVKLIARAREPEHAQILEACERHDPTRASRLLERHLATTANALSGAMGGRELFHVDDD